MCLTFYQTASKINSILKECAAHLAANRLTTGIGGTAVECYIDALKLDRGNIEALAGLEKIKKKYIKLIIGSLSNKHEQRAKIYLKRLRALYSEDAEIYFLDDFLLLKIFKLIETLSQEKIFLNAYEPKH